jgi:hypothetical protein
MPNKNDFPDKDSRRFGYSVAKVTFGTTPFIGGALQELLETVIGSPLRKRQEEWFRQLGKRLQELESRLEGFDPNELGDDPAFLSVALEATDRAMRTHHEEKVTALRNIVLNKAAHIAIDAS